jgi:hypothetical protein
MNNILLLGTCGLVSCPKPDIDKKENKSIVK